MGTHCPHLPFSFESRTPGLYTTCPLVSGTKVECKSEIYISSCVQYILNAKSVQKVFMNVRLDRLAGCVATSLTASRRSGAVHHVSVCVCFPLRIYESTGRLFVNCYTNIIVSY